MSAFEFGKPDEGRNGDGSLDPKQGRFKHRVSIGMGLVVVLLLVAASACAWPFGGGESKPKEKEVSTLPADASDVFVRLAGERTKRISEIEIVKRLSVEKKAELAGIDEQLRNRYGMDPGQVYTLDATNRTIQLVVSKPATKPGEKPTQELVPHRVFSDEASCDEFFTVVLAKRMTVRQIEVFDELLREKNLELSRVKDALKQRFKIDPERNYRYDAKARKLFEVLPPKVDAPVAAPKAVVRQPARPAEPSRPAVPQRVADGLPTANDVRAPFEKAKAPSGVAKDVKAAAPITVKK